MDMFLFWIETVLEERHFPFIEFFVLGNLIMQLLILKHLYQLKDQLKGK
tara:strand:+ start:363 stop:509 length:147 start_codon:yes stop_codon:yes gene_type:complete